MNHFFEEGATCDSAGLERACDLLADGELSLEDRRTLLSRLDETPGGWRRCALAFLEAQAWREDTRHLVSAPSAPIAAAAVPSGRMGQHHLTRWMGMAASFFLAFGLGLGLRDYAGGRRIDSGPAVAVRGNATMPQPIRETSISPNSLEGAVLAEANNPEHGVETIWLPASSSGEEMVLPTELAEELEGMGHRVERRQELWPVELRDGRRGLLPIERFDVRYVGHPYE